MTRQIILTIAFLSFAITFAAAQGLTVTYLDGTLEVQTSKGWRPLDVGSTISADARIRVSDSATVELRRGAQHISIIQDGEYAISDLLSGSSRVKSRGMGVSLASKLHSVAYGSGQTTNAVGGVRGAAQGDTGQDLTWMGDDEDTSLKVRALLDKQRFKEAETEITKALGNVQDDQMKQDLEYLLASAYYGEGESARAYHTLGSLKDNSASTYYPDSVILKAQILLDNGSYADSLSVLKSFLGSNPDRSYAQVSYLLSALCYKGLGDVQSEKAALSTGYSLDPQSDTAQQISKLQSE
jgi:Anaphase-promoting complex, cyclosome, subunit 3